MTRLLSASVILLSLPLGLVAADWPQWMGPNRDGVWPETGIVKEFPKDGPRLLWSMPVGGGYAGPAVAEGMVYVADKVLHPGAVDPKDPFAGDKVKVPARERVICRNAKNGQKVWKHEYEVVYNIQYPVGPRCTPLVNGRKVYSLGAVGDLFCLNADNGEVLWSKNFPRDYKVKPPVWGFAGHPLIYKNLLICLVGAEDGVLVAFDKDTGVEQWKALSAPEPGYNSPVLIEAGGATQLIVWTPRALHGLNPDSGSRYWEVPLEPKHAMSIMAARKDGDYLYAAGIGNVGVTLKLDRDKPAITEVWRGKGEQNPKTGVYPINMTPFAEGGVVYGADQPGMFRAIDIVTGKRLWSTYRPVFGEEKDDEFKGGACGTAFVVKNDDRFFLFTETGDLVIAKLTPTKYEEISRAHLIDPTTSGLNGRKVVWSHPAYADRCIFARNDRDLVCYSLAK